MHRLIALFLFVLLAGTLAGCGGDDDDCGEQECMPERVTVDIEGGRLTVRYPEGWVNTAEDSDVVRGSIVPYLGLATNQTLLDSSPDLLPALLGPGDIALIILAGTPQGDPSPEGMITGLLAEGNVNLTSASDVEPFRIEGRNAAIVYGTSMEQGQTVGAILCAVALGDVSAVLYFYLLEDEVDQTVPLARDIIAQMTFTPG
jgi:hypothetical protein